MSHTPNYDAKVKAILDATKPGERTCLASGKVWFMDEEEKEMYRKFKVPPSPYHPDVRQKLHGATYTAFSWWWHNDAQTGEKVLTHIHPHTGFKVIKDEHWYARDFAEYGRNVDFSRSFFDQLFELAQTVPLSALKNFQPPINSIARASFGDENSVFVVASQTRHSGYCENVLDTEDTLEAVASNHIYRSYNVIHSQRIADCRFVRESYDCMNSWFLFDCRNCEYCFGAANKRNRKYLWWNEQLSKEEWEKRFEQTKTNSWAVLKRLQEKFYTFVHEKAVWPNVFMTHCEQSTGEYLDNCVNCKQGFCCDGAKDEIRTVWSQMHSQDNAFGVVVGSSYCYECPVAVNSERALFSNFVSQCQRVEYCVECQDCEDCFGCFALRHKKFHIFNKAYSEQGYWEILDQIKVAMIEKGEYGRYFPGKFFHTPHDMSNGVTIYEDFSPLELANLQIHDFDHSLDGAYGDWSGKVFEDLSQIPDDSLQIDIASFKQKAFQCIQTHRPFTYQPLELELYKNMKLPLPREHFIKRVFDLWRELNMNSYETGTCRQCEKAITYAKNRLYPQRIIYCRECYLNYLEQNG